MRNVIAFLSILYNSGLIGQLSSSRSACLVSFPRMRLTYLIPHVQCGCNTVLVYLPKLGAPTRAVGCCLFSSRDAGSVDYVVGLQVSGTTLQQVTASAEGI